MPTGVGTLYIFDFRQLLKDLRRLWASRAGRWSLLLVGVGTVWIVLNAGFAIASAFRPTYEFQILLSYDGRTYGDEAEATDAAGVTHAIPTGTPISLDSENRAALLATRSQAGRSIKLCVSTRWPCGEKTLVESATDKTPKQLTSWLFLGVTRVLRSAAAIAFIYLSIALHLRLRNIQSFGFFVFALGYAPFPEGALNGATQGRWLLLQDVGNDLTVTIGLIGLLVFIDGLRVGRGVLLDTFAPPTALLQGSAFVVTSSVLVAGAVAAVAADVGFLVFGIPTERVWDFGSLVAPLLGCAGGVVFAAETERTSGSIVRARQRWIWVSMVAGITLWVLAYMAENAPVSWLALNALVSRLALNDEAIRNLYYLAVIVVPFAVLRTEVRHHLLNLGLFISRGAAYTTLIVLLTALFQAALSYFQRALAGTTTADRATATAATAVVSTAAVLITPLRTGLERFVSNTFLTARSAGLRQLNKVSHDFAALCYLPDFDVLVATEPGKALNLQATAFVSEAGVTITSGEFDYFHAELKRLFDEVKANAEFLKSGVGLALHEAQFTLAEYPPDVRPLWAVAVHAARGKPEIFFAGPHKDGTDLDSEELAALDAYFTRAATARVAIQMTGFERGYEWR